jgi:hypothetical protein
VQARTFSGAGARICGPACRRQMRGSAPFPAGETAVTRRRADQTRRRLGLFEKFQSGTCPRSSSQPGGPRTGAIGGGRDGSPMWARICSTGASSVTKAMQRRSAPQLGQPSSNDSNGAPALIFAAQPRARAPASERSEPGRPRVRVSKQRRSGRRSGHAPRRRPPPAGASWALVRRGPDDGGAGVAATL